MSNNKEMRKSENPERKRLSFQDLATMDKTENEKESTNNNEVEKQNEYNGVIVKTGQMEDLFISKPTMEDTHTRRTFLIRNDLLKQLDKTSDKPKNFTKTKFINYILEKGLRELKGE